MRKFTMKASHAWSEFGHPENLEKHINLWMHQLEMKRREIYETAGLMKLEWIIEEIEAEKDLEKWAPKCTNHFTRKMKRLLFEKVDIIVRNENGSEVARWCKANKVYDEIDDDEIDEIWKQDRRDDEEQVRLHGKCVLETAKRVCDFINTRDDIINITTFREYREVMLKVMKVIREAHNVEKKRRQTSRKKRSDGMNVRTQRAKSLIADVKKKD